MKTIETEVAHSDLSTLFAAGAVGGLPDAQLLERFATRRDEAAFEAIVARYGPLVWGVCRRILRHRHDAEDAFQATFIVLARRAGTIMPRAMLPNWLHGVARQSALKARAMLARREMRERLEPDMPETETAVGSVDHDLREIIDQELSLLPAAYRASIILCHLEGKGHRQAAEQLGWPVGTLSGRLSRARSLLAKRLERRGLALSTTALAAFSARPRLAESIVKTTVDSARFSLMVPAPPGLVASEVLSLAAGVIRVMRLERLKLGSLLLSSVAALSFGIITLAHGSSQDNRTRPVLLREERPIPKDREPQTRGSAKLIQSLDWALTKVDADKGLISGLSRWTWNSMANDEFADSGLQTGLHLSFKDFPVARDAEILIDGKPGKLHDLQINQANFQIRYGMQMVLKLSADGKSIVKIDAKSQNSYFFLQGIDVGRRAISVRVGTSGLLPSHDDLPVARDAKILIHTEKYRFREGQLTDLKTGMRVSLELAFEDGQIVVRGLRAQE
jgi:RNA polymerase sigma factor (sigma-70 family)